MPAASFCRAYTRLMVRSLRRASVVAVVVGAMTMAVRVPAARQARVSDTVVPSNAAIALSTPTNSLKSADLVGRLLAAANAPSGFERPALDPDNPPPFDFGAQPVELANLAGMRLGEALDAIARVDPSVRWTEHDGAVVVRMGAVSGDWLDQPSRPVDYRGSELNEALKAVASAIDPEHERTVNRAVIIGPPGSPQKPIESESLFVVLRPAGSAEQVLDALAREAHVRWDVSYSSSGPSVDSATILVRALPAEACRVSSASLDLLGAGGPQRVQLTAGGGVGFALLQYAKAAHHSGLSRCRCQNRSSRSVSLAADPAAPAQSIARILTFDSRYQWKEERGVFHVWPTMTITTGLDTPTRFFSASAQPLSSVVARLIELTGHGTLGQIFVTPGDFRQEVATQQRGELPALPVTATIQDVGDAEGVLDELCQLQGWSWQWRIGVPRNPGSLSIQGGEGWTVGQRVNAVPTVLQPTLNGRRYPPLPRDYPIARAGALIGGAQEDPFRGLFGSAGNQPIALELEPLPSSSSDPRVMPPSGTSVPLGPGMFSDGLATLLDHLPAYAMTTVNGLIEIAPRALAASPTHFLNVPLDHFEVRDATIGDAVRALRHRLDPAYPLMKSGETTTVPGSNAEEVQRRTADAEAVFSRHISLSLDHASPREILNRLVLANQDLRWTIRYESNPVGSAVRSVEEDCIMVLSTFPEIGVSRTFGPVPRPGSGAGGGPGDIPSGPPVAIVLADRRGHPADGHRRARASAASSCWCLLSLGRTHAGGNTRRPDYGRHGAALQRRWPRAAGALRLSPRRVAEVRVESRRPDRPHRTGRAPRRAGFGPQPARRTFQRRFPRPERRRCPHGRSHCRPTISRDAFGARQRRARPLRSTVPRRARPRHCPRCAGRACTPAGLLLLGRDRKRPDTQRPECQRRHRLARRLRRGEREYVDLRLWRIGPNTSPRVQCTAKHEGHEDMKIMKTARTIAGLVTAMVAALTASPLAQRAGQAPAIRFPEPTQADYVIKDFKFRDGQTLPEVRIHYRVLGTLKKDAQGHATNAVLIMHGTGGTGKQFAVNSFAGELFNPGQDLDAAKYFLVMPDDIGHGQSSKPSDGLRMKFPKYDYLDMVEGEYRLMKDGLGVDHLRLVMGTSMGGMHTWIWGEEHPAMMDALMPLASQPRDVGP